LSKNPLRLAKAPSINIQPPEKLQKPSFKSAHFFLLKPGVSLELGAWSLDVGAFNCKYFSDAACGAEF
jgi:hypothetical protein